MWRGQCLLSAVLYGQALKDFLKIARLHEQEETGKHRVERKRLSASRGSHKCFAVEGSSRNCGTAACSGDQGASTKPEGVSSRKPHLTHVRRQPEQQHPR